MANFGPDTNGSQFIITLDEFKSLDNIHVAFGRVYEGFEILDAIEECGDEEGKIIKVVTISNCGEIKE